MTAAVGPFGAATGEAEPVESPLARFRPAEGWTSVVALAILGLAFGWSIDDAGWVPPQEGSTGYLPWLGVVAALVGIGLAKGGLSRVRVALAGALIGGLTIPLLAGGIVLGDTGSLGWMPDAILTRYRTSADVLIGVWTDFVVTGQPYTSQFGHYHMIFAALVWAAGIAAASAVMVRHRPLDAVVVTGLLLLTNMSLTSHDQLAILVLFSVAALALLVRNHLLEEQLTWIRRRIGDPGAVAGLYLPGGATFVVVAVLGALVLTATASSSPLQGLWSDIPQRLTDLGQLVQRFAPGGGDPRSAGPVGFGPSAITNGLWAPDASRTAFVADLPPGDTRPYKWKAGNYAVYTLYGWNWGPTHTINRSAGAPLLAGTRDDPALGVATTPLTVTINPQSYIDASVLSPETIDSVDRQTTVVGVGAQTSFTTVQVNGGGSYTVQALVPQVGDTGSGLTENRLRAAGRNYPTDVTDVYLQVPTGAIGPAAQAVLDQVEATIGGRDAAEAHPYDLAKAMQTYLRDPSHFGYATDVRADVRRQCDAISTVECFARIREGYCEYYASEMTILLREAKVPARIAYGFLQGDRAANGVETVPAAAAHWWVEVYFPNSGWVEFDPTGGIGTPQALPSGAPVTPGPATHVPSAVPAGSGDDINPGGSRGAGGGTTTGSGPASPGPFAAVAVLLFLAVLAVAVAARRRSSRAVIHPDQAWGGLGRLAGRFGFGPRPQQTVYEYAGALGELVPASHVELSTVARAKVEVAYGRKDLGEDRLRSVGEAYRRLRLAVLRAGLARRFGRGRR